MMMKWLPYVVALALVGCATCPTQTTRQMGAMLDRSGRLPIAPFVYRGTSDGYHCFTHQWEKNVHVYSLTFKVAQSDLAVPDPFPLTADRLKWREFTAFCNEAGSVIEIKEWMMTSNPTSEGIRQPADGSPKPSM